MSDRTETGGSKAEKFPALGSEIAEFISADQIKKGLSCLAALDQ